MILTDPNGSDNFYSLAYLKLNEVSYTERDEDSDLTTIRFDSGDELELAIDSTSHDVLARGIQEVEDEQKLKLKEQCQNENLQVSNVSTQLRPLRVQTESKS